MRDNPIVADLVTRARNGDQQAWDALVERYASLIWSICRRYQLGGADAEDVAQAVWLKLVDHLDHLRTPAALPGWLSTTARRECARVLRAAGPLRAWERVSACESIPDTQTATADQELLAASALIRAAITGSRRSLSRHRLRLGPMLPAGMPSLAPISAYGSGGSSMSRASSRWQPGGSRVNASRRAAWRPARSSSRPAVAL